MARSEQGFIYFVQAGHAVELEEDGGLPIKIGYASNVRRRLVELNCDNVLPVTLLYSMPGTLKDEKELHRQFEHIHVRGEWFRAVDELFDFIADLRAEEIEKIEDPRERMAWSLKWGAAAVLP